MVTLTLRGPSLHENHAVVGGVLRDGTPHEARLHTLGGREHGSGGDWLVGTELADGWWVKARTAPPPGVAAQYLCCRGAGRRVEYQYKCVPP